MLVQRELDTREIGFGVGVADEVRFGLGGLVGVFVDGAETDELVGGFGVVTDALVEEDGELEDGRGLVGKLTFELLEGKDGSEEVGEGGIGTTGDKSIESSSRVKCLDGNLEDIRQYSLERNRKITKEWSEISKACWKSS